jgi:hypothetical protein
MNVEDIEKELAELKTKMRVLGRKRDLVIKNNKYKNNEEFRIAKKKQSLEYYHNVIKPTRIPKYKKITQ